MGKSEFDYYVFIDYSENLIGYLFLEKEKIENCLEVASRFNHYRETRNRKLYLKNAKKTFDKKEILACFIKKKIRNVLETPEIFADIARFLKENKKSKIFVSIDDRRYRNFQKFVEILEEKNLKIVNEGKLKKNSR